MAATGMHYSDVEGFVGFCLQREPVLSFPAETETMCFSKGHTNPSLLCQAPCGCQLRSPHGPSPSVDLQKRPLMHQEDLWPLVVETREKLGFLSLKLFLFLHRLGTHRTATYISQFTQLTSYIFDGYILFPAILFFFPLPEVEEAHLPLSIRPYRHGPQVKHNLRYGPKGGCSSLSCLYLQPGKVLLAREPRPEVSRQKLRACKDSSGKGWKA